MARPKGTKAGELPAACSGTITSLTGSFATGFLTVAGLREGPAETGRAERIKNSPKSMVNTVFLLINRSPPPDEKTRQICIFRILTFYYNSWFKSTISDEVK